MPPQRAATELRMKNVIICLTGAVETVELISKNVNTPFLGPIANTVKSLLAVAMNIRRNKDECIQLMDHTYKLLYAIVSLHLKSDIGPELPPSKLYDLGNFAETLHKVHAFVEAQLDKSRIKQFFRHGEMSTLLQDCNTGLERARDTFKLQDANLLKDVADMEEYVQGKQQEVIEMIEGISDDTGSSINLSSHNSSASLIMLPSEPKIFYGREFELSHILTAFRQGTPRLAILGPGGMGKTSLARAILHHAEITERYQHQRFFIACDSASTQVELAALIGVYLGLTGKNLTKAIHHHFTSNPACVLILDNLETAWEPADTRGAIEEFLSLLTDVPHLAIIITMRGTERPLKVSWTRPFLPPLEPLSQNAARQTFFDIADNNHDMTDVDKILQLTENMPLAIDLIAHLVDLEDCSHVLSRWEEERTSLISEGSNRKSNLDLSIELSLASPRISSVPHAEKLLSLLSLLPDGLSDVELLQSKLPIVDILRCKTALIRTSLAHITERGRLKILVPIREYMQKFHTPETYLVGSLLDYFQQILELYRLYNGTLSGAGVVAQITSNIANIQNILLSGLQSKNQTSATVCSIIHLSTFCRFTNRGSITLMNEIPNVLTEQSDPKLEILYVTEKLNLTFSPNTIIQDLVDRLLRTISLVDNPEVSCKFYNALGSYYQHRNSDFLRAMDVYQTSLSLAVSSGTQKRHSEVLKHLAWLKWEMGDYSGGQVYAYEAQRVANVSGNLWAEAAAIRIEAICWQPLGNYKHALFLCHRGRNLLTLCGMANSDLDHTLCATQAVVHELKSEYTEAHKIQMELFQGIDIEQQPFTYAFRLLSIANIDVQLDAPKHNVQRNLTQANSLFNTLGYRLGTTMCDTISANLALRTGDVSIAQELFHKCLNSSFVNAEIKDICLEGLGSRECWGPADSGVSGAALFLVHCLKLKQKQGTYRAFQFLAEMFKEQGDQETVSNLLLVALEGFTQMDVHQRRGECLLELAEIAKNRGDLMSAVEFWKTARPLFERSSQSKQVLLVDQCLSKISLNVLEEVQSG